MPKIAVVTGVGRATAHGCFDRKAEGASWEFFTDRHRDALMLGVACAGAILAGSVLSRGGC